MTLDAWIVAGLILWGLTLLIFIFGMLKAASRQDDQAENYHAKLNKKDTNV